MKVICHIHKTPIEIMEVSDEYVFVKPCQDCLIQERKNSIKIMNDMQRSINKDKKQAYDSI